MDTNTPPPGEVVARCRYRRGMTQEQLAEAAGLSVSAVKAIERGARTGRMAALHRLARALGVTTSDLFRPAAGIQVAPATEPDSLFEIRRTLTPPLGSDEAPDEPPEPLDWQDSLRYAERLYGDDRYDSALAAVPVTD
jgi:transcriptional regulator with XRE-family HTH domain